MIIIQLNILIKIICIELVLNLIILKLYWISNKLFILIWIYYYDFYLNLIFKISGNLIKDEHP
jgi:hypothetical protein